MPEYNLEEQRIVSVDPLEVISSWLTEWLLDDPDSDQPLHFYDTANTGAPCTLMDILQWYYQRRHIVRITIEDLGEDPFYARLQEIQAEHETSRTAALEALSSRQHLEKYRSI